MALTLADHAMQSTDLFEKGVVKQFVTTSDVMDLLEFKKIRGDAYKYRQEDVMPGVSWRRVNEAYPESTGLISPRTESLMIVGGDVFADDFIIQTQAMDGDGIDELAVQFDMKSRALAREFERAFFEGDPQVDPDELMGLRPRLTGGQVTLAGSGGAVLQTAMLDALLDNVAMGVGSAHLFMNKTLRRKLTGLVLTAGGSQQIQYGSIDKVGKQITMYNGVAVHTPEELFSTTTLLGMDEDPGDGTADTGSIYAVVFGEEMGVHAIYNGNGPIAKAHVVGSSLLGTAPGKIGRIEAYYGLCIKNPRAAARLRGVLAA